MTDSTPIADSTPSPAEDASEAAGAPEFEELASAGSGQSGAGFQLDRFAGVQVVLTAELGRATLSLQQLMDLSEGSVIDLNRNISAPVELVAQGVALGNGEVVVLEDRFAIRIKELYQSPNS